MQFTSEDFYLKKKKKKSFMNINCIQLYTYKQRKPVKPTKADQDSLNECEIQSRISRIRPH